MCFARQSSLYLVLVLPFLCLFTPVGSHLRITPGTGETQAPSLLVLSVVCVFIPVGSHLRGTSGTGETQAPSLLVLPLVCAFTPVGSHLRSTPGIRGDAGTLPPTGNHKQVGNVQFYKLFPRNLRCCLNKVEHKHC